MLPCTLLKCLLKIYVELTTLSPERRGQLSLSSCNSFGWVTPLLLSHVLFLCFSVDSTLKKWLTDSLDFPAPLGFFFLFHIIYIQRNMHILNIQLDEFSPISSLEPIWGSVWLCCPLLQARSCTSEAALSSFHFILVRLSSPFYVLVISWCFFPTSGSPV